MFSFIAASLLQVLTTGAVLEPKVVAVPFGGDTAERALADAVANALPKAASDRGLTAVRADSVRPVHEQMRACREDGCRAAAARRLGARYAVVGAVDRGALLLKIVDVEVGDAVGEARVDGAPPQVLASVPDAVDALVEQVSPKATRAKNAALARARRALAAGDLDDADGAFAAAIDATPPSAAAVDLWLERCRLYDAADRAKEARVWDAFAAALGPGTPGFSALSDDDKARVKTAVHQNLRARADFEVTAASGDRAERLLTAARIHERIAALFPDEAAEEQLLAARLKKDAGDQDGARAIFRRLSRDDDADDDARLEAVLRLHGAR